MATDLCRPYVLDLGDKRPAAGSPVGKPVVRRGRKARDLAAAPGGETARLPCRWLTSSRSSVGEGETGTLHIRNGGPGILGSGPWRRHPLGMTVMNMRPMLCRALLALSTLASLALVLGAGHRWS